MKERLTAAWRGFAAEPFGYALTGLFVGGSTAIGIMFAYNLGRQMHTGLMLVLVMLAIAAELFKSSWYHLTWKRGRWAAGFYTAPFFLVCFAYSINATYQFAQENLITRDWRATSHASQYMAAQSDIETLNKRIAPLANVRSATVIEAEIKGMLLTPHLNDCAVIDNLATRKWCPVISERRTELAQAQARDDLLRLKGEKQKALALMEPPSTSGSADSAGPVAGALAALFGLQMSWSEMTARIFMLILEGGALFVPIAAVTGARPASPSPYPAPLGASAVPAVYAEPINLPHDYGNDSVNQVAMFFHEACEKRRGAALRATVAWDEFLKWCAAKGHPVKVKRNQFWRLASMDLKLPRDDITTPDGKGIHYLNLAIRPPAKTIAAVLTLRPNRPQARTQVTA
jgi:hypothetical protein